MIFLILLGFGECYSSCDYVALSWWAGSRLWLRKAIKRTCFLLVIFVCEHLEGILRVFTNHFSSEFISFLLVCLLRHSLSHRIRSSMWLFGKNSILHAINLLLRARLSLSTLCNSVLNYLIFINWPSWCCQSFITSRLPLCEFDALLYDIIMLLLLLLGLLLLLL